MIAFRILALNNNDPCPDCETPVQKRQNGMYCRKCNIYYQEKKLQPLDEKFLTNPKDVRWSQIVIAKKFIERMLGTIKDVTPVKE